jgi:hypothetical protein
MSTCGICTRLSAGTNTGVQLVQRLRLTWELEGMKTLWRVSTLDGMVVSQVFWESELC